MGFFIRKSFIILLLVFSLLSSCPAFENKELGLREIYANKQIGVYVFYCNGSVKELTKTIKFYDTLPLDTKLKTFRTVFIFYNKNTLNVNTQSRSKIFESIENAQPDTRYFYSIFKTSTGNAITETLTLFDETGYPKHNFERHNRGEWLIKKPSDIDLLKYYKRETNEKNIF